MILDDTTVAVLAALIVTLCGATFVLSVTLRFDDAAGRLFSVGFVAIILMALSSVVTLSAPGAGWPVVVGSAVFASAIGMLFSGLRVTRGRTPLLVVPAVAGLGVAGVATLGLTIDLPLDQPALFAGTSIVSVLVASQAGSAPLRANPNSQLLAVVFALVGAYQFGRLAAYVTIGDAHPVYETLFDPTPANVVLACLIVIVTISLALLQADRAGGRADDDRPGRDGVLAAAELRSVGEAWMRQSRLRHRPLAALGIEIANLDEIRVAFGRSQRDSAVGIVDGLAFDQVPVGAVLGRVSASRVVAIFPAPADGEPDALASRLQRDVLRTVVDEADRFRAAVRVVVARSVETDGGFDALLELIDTRLAEVESAQAPAALRRLPGGEASASAAERAS